MKGQFPALPSGHRWRPFHGEAHGCPKDEGSAAKLYTSAGVLDLLKEDRAVLSAWWETACNGEEACQWMYSISTFRFVAISGVGSESEG
jgi:hypothetical protein